jgi:hypothetical protein
LSVWFVVPAHGRHDLTSICLRLLADACAVLTDNGLEATAVVIADDENLDIARELGFATVEQDNMPLGRKFNDGFQLATDPQHNPRPADHVIPLGSDDWIDPELILTAPLPRPGSVTCFRQAAFVREDGRELTQLQIPFRTGVGIRILPAADIAQAGYRPAEDYELMRLDGSILRGIRKAIRQPTRILNHDLHPLQIVDWKTPGGNLYTYDSYVRYQRDPRIGDPFEMLADTYPGWALDAMRGVYHRQPVAA